MNQPDLFADVMTGQAQRRADEISKALAEGEWLLAVHLAAIAGDGCGINVRHRFQRIAREAWRLRVGGVIPGDCLAAAPIPTAVPPADVTAGDGGGS